MGFEVRITGIEELRALSARMRAVGDAGLGKNMAKALRGTLETLKNRIRVETATLPSSGGYHQQSGYSEILAASLGYRTEIRPERTAALVSLLVHASGRKEKRDLPAVDRGVLRHPVFGRSRPIKRHWLHGATSKPNPWVAQPVTPGVVSRPFRAHVDVAERALVEVIDDFVDRIK